MAQTTDLRSGNPGTTMSPAQRERRASVRRVSLEQERADFAAWLREYRRWTQTGSCAPARAGEIEWGGEEGSGTSH